MIRLLPAVIAVMATAALAADIPKDERRSGFSFMSRETQAMQQDETLNSGMLWVADGESLWSEAPSATAKSCAGCHNDATVSMRGVAARYPAFDEKGGRAIDLEQRINLCRQTHQQQPVFEPESRPLLGLAAYIGHQSKGLPIAPPDDPRLAETRARGKALFSTPMGQLNFSCAQGHDDNWGKRLAGSPIPQAHPTGYPIYRLEWQAMGSLQRRLRNCMTGVRAEPFAYGASEMIELELYLADRAKGMALETPAVRP